MADRAVAGTNQWKEKAGAGVGGIVVGRLVADPDFPGFVTVADAGVRAAVLVEDPDFPGFVTADDAATESDAEIMITGGFATTVEA